MVIDINIERHIQLHPADPSTAQCTRSQSKIRTM